MNLISILLAIVCTITHYPTYTNAPISQEFGIKGHVGIDIYVPAGSDVYADLEGVVIQEEDNTRVYGRYMIIEHPDGNASLFAHLSAFKVKVGDYVKAGELVALSGGDASDNLDGDGWSIRPHLHWEIRIKEHLDNNLYNIDPLKYLESFYDYNECIK